MSGNRAVTLWPDDEKRAGAASKEELEQHLANVWEVMRGGMSVVFLPKACYLANCAFHAVRGTTPDAGQPG